MMVQNYSPCFDKCMVGGGSGHSFFKTRTKKMFLEGMMTESYNKDHS